MLPLNPEQIHCMFFSMGITARASSLSLPQMATHPKMAHSSKSNWTAHHSLAIYL